MCPDRESITNKFISGLSQCVILSYNTRFKHAVAYALRKLVVPSGSLHQVCSRPPWPLPSRDILESSAWSLHGCVSAFNLALLLVLRRNGRPKRSFCVFVNLAHLIEQEKELIPSPLSDFTDGRKDTYVVRHRPPKPTNLYHIRLSRLNRMGTSVL